ncbi:hypothetical protein BJV78DRAFT_1200250 [Lactifluus subvellereus]|nr:hypothetical protein BJV78DRAFT_1200250 [Lactifluus subvellereus]
MKFSATFLSLLVIVPLLVADVDAAAARGRGRGRGRGLGAANATAAAAANTTAAAAANTTAVNVAANNTAAANSSDPQSSLTLDPAVIAVGFESDGQAVPVAGQIASLTSSNNFINFCLTVPNLPITNGQQVTTGSCNPAPMGIIAATTNMPSSKFVSPVNGQDIGPAGTPFTISMAINHLETGNFVNAKSNYYAAPQQINGGGDIIGHTHFTVTNVGSFTSTTPQDPNVFAFFKGVNGAAVNGVVSENVAAGLPAGIYRLCSMNTDANHAPCLVAVAQHGSLDDCVYFSVGGQGAAGNPFGGAANSTAAANATAAAPAANPPAAAAANSTAAAPAAAAPAASSPAAKNTAAPPAAPKAAAPPAAQKGKGGKRSVEREY